jgi:hypothetical protein|nr:MAG TPA: Protein of unknown function (DUF3277) [Caudoviricetes sp.]
MTERNIYTYDARDVTITVNGQYMTGFAEDAKVSIEKNEDNILPKVGVDGIVHYGINADGTATCTMTFMNTSPSLQTLRQLAKERQPFTMAITDMNDNAESYALNDCMIVKSMDDAKGFKEPDEVEVEVFIPYFEDLRAR